MLLDDSISLMQERARSEERQRFMNLHRRQFQARSPSPWLAAIAL